MDDATYERIVDRRVQSRLAADPAYKNARNAEEQTEREESITREVEHQLAYEYELKNMAAAHAEGLHAEIPREFCPECQ